MTISSMKNYSIVYQKEINPSFLILSLESIAIDDMSKYIKDQFKNLNLNVTIDVLDFSL